MRTVIRMKSGYLGASLFFLIFGIVLTLLGFVFGFAFNDVDSEYMTEKATGSIVDVISERNNGDINKFAIVEYEVDGITYETSPSYSSDLFKIGKRVTVFYDPTNPIYASVAMPAVIITIFNVMKIVGIVCLAICIITLIVYFKKKNNTNKNDYREPWEIQ